LRVVLPKFEPKVGQIKTKETRHTDKKEPRSLRKALLFILLSLLSLLLLLKIGKRGAHSYSHHRERILRERERERLECIKEREKKRSKIFSLELFLYSSFPGKTKQKRIIKRRRRTDF